MVKAPHCTEEAWKFPLSTWRYLVLTVCERNRLNKATFVPLATQTAIDEKIILREIQMVIFLKLTIGILQALLLLGGLWDHFNAFRVEDPDICAIAIKHFQWQHKMLTLVWIRNKQRFGCAIMLQKVKKKDVLLLKVNISHGGWYIYYDQISLVKRCNFSWLIAIMAKVQHEKWNAKKGAKCPASCGKHLLFRLDRAVAYLGRNCRCQWRRKVAILVQILRLSTFLPSFAANHLRRGRYMAEDKRTSFRYRRISELLWHVA